MLKISILLAALTAVCFKMPLLDSHRAWLFDRNNFDFECPIPSDEDRNESLTRYALMSEHMQDKFSRDGVLILQDALSQDWLRSFRRLLMHVFENESKWDILFSRMNANFYSAQKSIFLHQSSRCGRYLGSMSPIPALVANLFSKIHSIPIDQVKLRVIEPTVALINVFDAGGHTAWHRDDAYMRYKQVEDNSEGNNNTVVIRVWVPLMDMSLDDFTFIALNNSHASKTERLEAGIDIQGSNFRLHEELVARSDMVERQTIGPEPSRGYKAGDLLVFAGDTPHFAQGNRCGSTGCARMIFSFALDGAALYDNSKMSPIMPLYSGQAVGQPLRGAQFPLIFPEPLAEDWENPLAPTYGDISLSLLHSFYVGAVSFYGVNLEKATAMFTRVGQCFVENVWFSPQLDLETGVRTEI